MFEFGFLKKNNFTFNLPIILLLLLFQQSPDDVFAADSVDFYFPGSINLERLLKLNNVKMLRKDLLEHLKYVQDLVTQLDSWAFNEIKTITDYTNLDNYKVMWLEKEVNRIRSMLNDLKSNLLLENNVNTSKIIENYKILQKDVENLNDHFGEKTVNSLNLLKEYYGESFPDLIELHKDLLRQTVRMHKSVKLKERDSLISELIKNIQNKEYEIAVNKLDMFFNNNNENADEDAMLNDIVRRVYNNNENNFEIVLKFGDKIRNITKSFHVYQILMYEMETNRQVKDGKQIIGLIKSLKNEVIYQLKTVHKIKTEALALEEYLWNRLKPLANENLRQAILNDSYYDEYMPFFESLLLMNEPYYAEINQAVLDKFYMDNGDFPIFGWIMEAFTEIFGKLFKKHLNNDETVLKLAYFIKYLTEKDEVIKNDGVNLENFSKKNLNNILLDSMENYKKKLPESVKNLVFTKKEICIKNVGLNEYLQAADVSFSLNKFNVFTRKINNTDDFTVLNKWQFNCLGNSNICHIGSKMNHTVTYLYTSDIELDDDNKSYGHIVYTWVPDDSLKLGIWQVIPSKENCFIKNILNNEYLFVSIVENHYAYTLDVNNDNNVNYWKWVITNCTLM